MSRRFCRRRLTWEAFTVSVALLGCSGQEADSTREGALGRDAERATRGSEWAQVQTLVPHEDGSNAFGTALGTHETTLISGARSFSDEGSAYVYVLDGGSWVEQAVLHAAEGQSGDGFGFSVAVAGDWAVVGAPFDAADGEGSGAAYLFKRDATTWSEVDRLTADDVAEGRQFGFSVALTKDALVIGANLDSELGANAGAAYLFTRAEAVWSQQQKLLATDSSTKEGDNFGTAVALDSTRAVVTAMGNGLDDAGSAFVFEPGSPNWSSSAELRASDTVQYDGFGSAVALVGNSVLVGAPSKFAGDGTEGAGAAYVFRFGTEGWLEEKLEPLEPLYTGGFGSSVALSADVVAVGGPWADTGYAYLFTNDGAALGSEQRFAPDTPVDGEQVGVGVAVVGRAVIVGCALAGEETGQALVLGLVKGVGCGADADCASGFCVEGVCCGARCGHGCESCLAARKGTGADGDCGPVAAGTDPANHCAATPEAACGTTGMCNGSGKCALYAPGVVCVSASCVDDQHELPAAACDGLGTCLKPRSRDCDGFLCSKGACATECSESSSCDVDGGFSCLDHVCKLPDGGACTRAQDCNSGHCADGVCCDSDCDGECEACTRALRGNGYDGACGPVRAGRDPEDECQPDSAQAPCGADGACDGRGRCRSSAPEGVPCGTTVCKGESVQGFLCNGEGSCEQSRTECAPARCGEDACLESCTSDDDCAEGAHCGDAGVCEAKRGAADVCADAGDCTSGFCVDGLCCNTRCAERCETCAQPGSEGECVAVVGDASCAAASNQSDAGTCSSTNDCATGLACNPSTHLCEAVVQRSRVETGCALATSKVPVRGGGVGALGGSLAFAAAVLTSRRRKRRRTCPPEKTP